MAKKKKKTRDYSSVLKVGFVIILAGLLGFGLYFGVDKFLRTSSYFKIKTVRVDPSLQFINEQDLKKMIGGNIFDADLKMMQSKLKRKYPQVESLKIIKRFPNEIHVTAKKREPLAQIVLNNIYFTLNDRAMVVAKANKQDKDFPIIEGVDVASKDLSLGQYVRGKNVLVALNFIQELTHNMYLTDYKILQIDISNLSKIDLELKNGIHIYFEVQKMEKKVDVLGLVLSQGKLDLQEVKYIDMRFKEPIMGKK